MRRQFDFERLVELCGRTHEETRRSAGRAIDRSLVVRNWLFGWYIVEFEGGGSARQELYGKELIDRLSERLRTNGVKGCSPSNLRKCREFYRVFAEIRQTVSVESGERSKIRQTVSVESFAPRVDIASPSLTDLAEQFPLAWSHIRHSAVRNRPRRPPLLRDRDRRQWLERPRTQTSSSTAPSTSGSRSVATNTRSAAWPVRGRLSRRRRT